MLLPLQINNLLVGGGDVEVNCNTAALTLTTYAATVSYDVEVSAGTAALTLATQSPSVTLDVDVSAGVVPLSLATYGADIDVGNTNVNAGTVSLNLQTYQATVDGIRISRGGRSTKKSTRKRYVVEVEGQFFEVASVQEAQQVLQQIRDLAQESAEKDTKSEAIPKPPRVSIKTASGNQSTSKALTKAVKQVQKEINRTYVKVAETKRRDAEISRLLAEKLEDERKEEEALIALLM